MKKIYYLTTLTIFGLFSRCFCVLNSTEENVAKGAINRAIKSVERKIEEFNELDKAVNDVMSKDLTLADIKSVLQKIKDTI